MSPVLSLFLSSLCCLPLKPASPPVLMSRSLLPYHSAAATSPWLLNRPWFLPPTSVLSFSQSSSLLTSITGFAPFLLLLRALLCHIPSFCASPLLSELSPLPGVARAAGERLSEPLLLHGRCYQLSSARCANRGRFMALASDLPCPPSAAAVSSSLTFC